MALGSKNRDEDIFDNLKILATTVETLNKQIESGGGGGGVSPHVEQKLDSIINGLNILNNKMYQQNSSIDKKVTGLVTQYSTDMKKMEVFMTKNNAILELLKATVELLEETVDVMKDNAKR